MVEEKYDVNYWKEWMKYIPDKSINLKNIIIPGSHDAGSYILNFQYPKLIEEEEFSKYRKFLWIPIVKYIFKGWAITQNYSIYEQCRRGIRFFDIRLKQAEDGSWWTFHSFKNISFLNFLNQLDQFTKENPTEIIYLGISNRNTIKNDDKLHQHLMLYKESRIVDLSIFNMESSLEQVLESGKNWILFSDSSLYESYPNMYFPLSIITGKWINSFDDAYVRSEIKAELKNKVSKDLNPLLYSRSWTKTPQTKTIILSAISKVLIPGLKTSLYQSTKKWNRDFDSFASENSDDISSKIWSISGDFIDETTIRSWLIKWNNLIN